MEPNLPDEPMLCLCAGIYVPHSPDYPGVCPTCGRISRVR